MTDIARKRTYTEATKVPSAPRSMPVADRKQKKPKIEGKKTEEVKNIVDQLLDDVKMNSTEAENDEQYACEGTISLFYLASKTPTMLKKRIDEILEQD